MSANPIDDQIAAATEHTARIVGDIFLPDGTPVIDPRGWVLSVAGQFMTAYLRDHRTCGHLQHPQPLFGMPSQMGVMYCLSCFVSRLSASGSFVTCDRCAAPADDLGGTAMSDGPFVLVLMLCGACRTATLAEQE